jgi:cytidylate kinase
MIHVLPKPHLPLDAVLAYREEERAALLAYGAALAREQAAHRAVQVWHSLYGRCRARIEEMHPHDRERMHDALKRAEDAAIIAHEAATAELVAIASPFTIMAETMSRACGQ